MFVWLDETGFDWCNNIQRYGYGLRGMTQVDHQLRIGGKRVSAIEDAATAVDDPETADNSGTIEAY